MNRLADVEVVEIASLGAAGDEHRAVGQKRGIVLAAAKLHGGGDGPSGVRYVQIDDLDDEEDEDDLDEDYEDDDEDEDDEDEDEEEDDDEDGGVKPLKMA